MHNPAAMAVPDPLLDPPGMCSRFYGFRASGNRRWDQGHRGANSCIASLPSRIVPGSGKTWPW